MGIEFTIEADASLIHVKVSGDIEANEVETIRTQWQSHPDFRPDLDMICDLREVYTQLAREEARRLAHYFITARPVRRLAFVSAEAFAWGPMYEGWTGDDQPIQVFKDMASAREWLGLPPEEE